MLCTRFRFLHPFLAELTAHSLVSLRSSHRDRRNNTKSETLVNGTPVASPSCNINLQHSTPAVDLSYILYRQRAVSQSLLTPPRPRPPPPLPSSLHRLLLSRPPSPMMSLLRLRYCCTSSRNVQDVQHIPTSAHNYTLHKHSPVECVSYRASRTVGNGTTAGRTRPACRGRPAAAVAPLQKPFDTGGGVGVGVGVGGGVGGAMSLSEEAEAEEGGRNRRVGEAGGGAEARAEMQ